MIPLRIVVVGSGVIGLLTAVECVRAGTQVDVVDKDDIPSPWATSNDLHRVVRALHRGDAALTLAGARAIEGWLDVQQLLGARFYHQVGVLTVMPAAGVPANLALLAGAGAAARAVSAAELPARYPQIRLPAGGAEGGAEGDLQAIFEPPAGAVLAGQALLELARWLGRQPGVRLYPQHRVTAIDEDGAVRFADGTELAGDSVVVAAGPWSGELMPPGLRGDLTLYRQTMLSYAPPARAWGAGTPAILGLGAGHDAWLMPPVAGTPARLSAASACRVVAEMTGRDTAAEWFGHLTGRFSELLTGFDPAAVTGAADGYYLAGAADGQPLLVGLGDGAVWAYAACGGMSFKFAPLIARTLADRATGRPPRPAGLAAVDRPRQFAAAAAAREGVDAGSRRRTS
ncbi:MAG TPA: FAD-binding oxidoreductase [Streptosporangiaceae bacterium]